MERLVAVRVARVATVAVAAQVEGKAEATATVAAQTAATMAAVMRALALKVAVWMVEATARETRATAALMEVRTAAMMGEAGLAAAMDRLAALKAQGLWVARRPTKGRERG